MPVSRRTARSNPLRRWRRSWNRAEIFSTSGTSPLPHLVHDVVAEALEQAHDRLGLAEEALLLVAHERLHPVLPAGFAAERPADRPERVSPEGRGAAAEQAQLALESLGEVRPQPGMGLELEGMGRLVEGDPGPERRDRDAQRVRRAPDVLLDEQQPAVLRLGREHREVVLARGPACP